jgi:hypothetical protein
LAFSVQKTTEHGDQDTLDWNLYYMQKAMGAGALLWGERYTSVAELMSNGELKAADEFSWCKGNRIIL